jgi:hypothetical protein
MQWINIDAAGKLHRISSITDIRPFRISVSLGGFCIDRALNRHFSIAAHGCNNGPADLSDIRAKLLFVTTGYHRVCHGDCCA